MDETTITTNTSDTSCSGAFQLSSDNFDTCVKMTGLSFTASNSHKTFTIENVVLANSTFYKYRFTSGATDLAGNNLEGMTAIDFRQ